MDGIVHFEITAGNVSRAKSFYKKVFGWGITPVPKMEYEMVRTTEVGKDRMPKEKGVINGGMMKRNSKLKGTIVTIAVKSIDKTLEKLSKSGGKMVSPKTPVMDMGYIAYFKDTEGNVVGLWENKKM